MAHPRVLIVATGPMGSVGDEAATQALVRCAQQLGACKVGVVVYAPDDDWGLGAAEPPVEMVLVPSWPFERARWSVPAMHTVLQDFDHVLVVGADCIDGGYSEEGTRALLDLARFADERGCRVAIVNCSFNARPAPGIVAAIAQVPSRISFWFRDTLSAESFTRATGRPAHLGAEIAFLTEPASPPRSHPTFEWVRVQRQTGKRIVVLVPNPLAGTAEPLWAPQRNPAPYVDVLAGVLDPGGDVACVVLPNDARESVGDLELTRAIAARLPAELRASVFCAPQTIPGAMLCDLFGHVDLVIGARFHALVMALIAGTPIVALEYQDKMRGVLRAFGLEELWIPCEHGLIPATIVARAADALGRADEIRDRIATSLPPMRRRARAMVMGALAGS